MIRYMFIALLAAVTGFAEVKQIHEDDFEDLVSSGTVVVDFYGEWCGPCKRIAPVLEAVSNEMKGQVTIYKVNIDKARALSDKYEVRGVPTLVLFQNGVEARRSVGFIDKTALKKFITSG